MSVSAPRSWVVIAVSVAVACATVLALGYPGKEIVIRAGESLTRVGKAIDDLRTRSGIRRLPWIGKFWRPEPIAISPEIYNRLFPRYIQVCTMTQYVAVVRDEDGKVTGLNKGGWGGHAMMFINGACHDEDSVYPRLKICGDDGGLADPDSGVGVSVNQVFRNVNWIGLPGRSFFLHGGLSREKVLDEARFDETVRRAAESGLFDGIGLRADLRSEANAHSPTAERVVRESIGTDFAATFARTLYCSRLPVPKEVLGAIIGKLNQLNEQYALTGEPYHWDVIEDNCSHAVHNAIAASGLWDPKRTRLGGARVLGAYVEHYHQFTEDGGWHLSFPFNNMVRLAEAGNLRPIDNVVDAFRNSDIRRTFERFRWISTGHGALVETQPIHPEQRNHLFVEGDMPFAGSLPFNLPGPVRNRLSKREISTLNPEGRFREFFSDDRYRRILDNLESYRDRYEAILESAEMPLESYPAYRKMSKEEKAEFRDFRRNFFAYIHDQLLDVNTKIGRYTG